MENKVRSYAFNRYDYKNVVAYAEYIDDMWFIEHEKDIAYGNIPDDSEEVDNLYDVIGEIAEHLDVIDEKGVVYLPREKMRVLWRAKENFSKLMHNGHRWFDCGEFRHII